MGADMDIAATATVAVVTVMALVVMVMAAADLLGDVLAAGSPGAEVDSLGVASAAGTAVVAVTAKLVPQGASIG
jgi:hypothetical protein